jgi:hypothetical protein
MAFDPSRVPSGLSWGTRGFRVGKSVSGNWWVSLGLPFGFRYTWLIGRKKTRLPRPGRDQEEVIDAETIEVLPGTSTPTSNATRTENQKLLDKIKNKG